MRYSLINNRTVVYSNETVFHISYEWKNNSYKSDYWIYQYINYYVNEIMFYEFVIDFCNEHHLNIIMLIIL